MRKLIGRVRGERGQALVELAFVIPLVLLFLFGIIDFGLALNQQNSETNIANVGVREAAVYSGQTVTCGGQQDTYLSQWVACQSAATGGPTLSSVCVYDETSTNPSVYSYGDAIEVKVSAPFSWVKLVSGAAGTGLTSSINASATMRIEGSLTQTTPTFFTNTSAAC